MYTINIQIMDDGTRVSLCRWGREGRYPALLANAVLEPQPGSTDLGQVASALAEMQEAVAWLRHHR